MARNLRVRYKLAILVAVPLLTCLFNTGALSFLLWNEERRHAQTMRLDSGKIVPTEAEEGRLNSMTLLLIGGVVYNIVLTSALLLFATRQFEQRFAAVQANLSKLQNGEELNPPLKDFDEFAQLDKQVHRAAEVLRASK